MNDWSIWQNIGFGALVIVMFLYFGLQAWKVYCERKNRDESMEKADSPLEIQIVLNILNEYLEQNKENTNVLAALTRAIDVQTATQKEMGAAFNRVSVCVDSMQLKLDNVAQMVDHHNDFMNDFNKQLAIIQEKLSK